MSENSYLKYKEKANHDLKMLKECGFHDKEQVHLLLRNYIGHKFLLELNECKTDNILELAKIALSKQLAIPYYTIGKRDIADCSGATVSMTKKVLLLMKIEKELEIHFTPDETFKNKTIKDLSERIVHLKSF